jgi:SRSO17 transposase
MVIGDFNYDKEKGIQCSKRKNVDKLADICGLKRKYKTYFFIIKIKESDKKLRQRISDSLHITTRF